MSDFFKMIFFQEKFSVEHLRILFYFIVILYLLTVIIAFIIYKLYKQVLQQNQALKSNGRQHLFVRQYDSAMNCVIDYKKSFIFWIPKFPGKESELASNFKKTEQDFEQQMEIFAGGFSKWQVDGIYKNNPVSGYYYQVSFKDEQISIEILIRELNEYLIQDSWLITEITH